MLRQYEVVSPDVFTKVCKYEVGNLYISKNKETNKFQIFKYSKSIGKSTLLVEVSVCELRYCCSFSPALLQAVFDYYDKETTTINDMQFVGIPKNFGIREIMSEFNFSCNLAISKFSNIDDTINVIEDQIDMFKYGLNILRTYNKLQLIKTIERGN